MDYGCRITRKFRLRRLDFEEFFKLLLKLRGSNTATVKDLVEMRKFVIQELGLLEGCLGGMLEQILARLGNRASPEV